MTNATPMSVKEWPERVARANARCNAAHEALTTATQALHEAARAREGGIWVELVNAADAFRDAERADEQARAALNRVLGPLRREAEVAIDPRPYVWFGSDHVPAYQKTGTLTLCRVGDETAWAYTPTEGPTRYVKYDELFRVVVVGGVE